MTTTNIVLHRYAGGEISATEAAGLLGSTYNVADVIIMLRQAGLRPPEPSVAEQRAQLAQAWKVLGRSSLG